MLKKLFAASVLVAAVSVASAEITASVLPLGSHVLDGSGGQPAGTVVWVYDLQVTVTGDDAWTVAGGLAPGVPWITLLRGAFFHSTVNDGNPPDPALFGSFPDSEWTSFYTTHRAFPNTPNQGVSPGFAYGPIDNPTSLIADWFCVPDGSAYPGTITIARFSIIDDTCDAAYFDIDMQIGSAETPPFGIIYYPEFYPPRGDVNCDFVVDWPDLAALLGAYGTCSGEPDYVPTADFDWSGCIDLADLAALLSCYGCVGW